VTEPPQPPGGEPDQPAQQPVSYGYPGGPAEPPARKSKAGVITAVVVGAVLVLGGGGAGVYFLTKADDPKNTGSSSSQTGSPGAKPTTPASGSGAPTTPPNSTSQAPTSGTAAPTTGGGGGGGGTGGADDAAITQVAEKYAKAVSGKDEAGAKAVTCDNDTGLLYSSAEKVEVVGKPDKYGDDTASINVKVSLGGGTEPIDNFPLFMDKKSNGWCISN
jgi:hypothetical protein